MKVLKFHATWCAPCKMLSKVIEDAGDKLTLPFENIDIDENMDLAKKYGIRGVPTMVIVNDSGEEIKRQSGVMNENELIDFLKG